MKPTGLLVVSQVRDSGAGRELPPKFKIAQLARFPAAIPSH